MKLKIKSVSSNWKIKTSELLMKTIFTDKYGLNKKHNRQNKQ